MSKASKEQKTSVQTTGHAWDGDLQEYNNPIPRWWIWTFYATVVFAVVYWILFPAWPVGKSYTTGMFNDITFLNSKGEEVTTHWNTRSLFIAEKQRGDLAVRQQKALTAIAATPYEDILKDPEQMAFVNSMSKVLFADNCAACHGSGAAGIVGSYPNLVDDDWLWGGTIEDIETSVAKGRRGFMPAFEASFDPQQMESVSQYVLSLSDGNEGGDADKIAAGDKIFNGAAGGCHYCHGTDATGLKSIGAANLTDRIWTVVDVAGADSYKAKLARVKSVISQGVTRTMPGWDARLSAEQIKLLTVYVYQHGGGQ